MSVTAGQSPKYFQESASGIPLALFGFGFALAVLSLSNTELVTLEASLFVPVALGTGALGMFVGGMWEFRNGNLFGATFSIAYACFLFTSAAILRWFAPALTEAAGAGGFGDAFGAWFLLWALVTAGFTVGAYYVALPAFLTFALLTIVFLLLGIVNLTQPESTTLLNIAGWIGLADVAAAWYLGMGLVLNSMTPRPVLPLRPYPYGAEPVASGTRGAATPA